MLHFPPLLGLLHIENLPTQLATTPEPSCLQSISFFGQWPLQQSCLQAQALVQWVARKRATYVDCWILECAFYLISEHFSMQQLPKWQAQAQSGIACTWCTEIGLIERRALVRCPGATSREQTSSLSSSKGPSSDGELGTLPSQQLSSA